MNNKEVIILGGGISGNGCKELLDYLDIKNYLVNDKEIFELNINFDNIKYFIKSPGISWDNEAVKFLIKKGIKVISEIELAYEYMPKEIKLIAFTGTNGKTTTATKTYEILKYFGKKVKLAGNVGISFAKVVKYILESNEKIEYIVLELSSYQLENNLNINFFISGIINLTPDHLSRYKDVDEYYNTKFNIFNSTENMIINENDRNFYDIYIKKEYNVKKMYINSDSKTEKSNIYVENDKICIENETCLIDELSLKGIHNVENQMFILAVCKILNLDINKAFKFLKETKSLEHRMEEFFKLDNLVFINDSKGTNTYSTIKAINSYKDNVILILGGDDKKIDNSEMIELISKKNIYCYLIGSNHNVLIETFKKFKYSKYKYLETIDNVLEEIFTLNKKNKILKKTIILFSPATSSFDQFKNFEDRGRKFKEKTLEKYKEIYKVESK